MFELDSETHQRSERRPRIQIGPWDSWPQRRLHPGVICQLPLFSSKSEVGESHDGNNSLEGPRHPTQHILRHTKCRLVSLQPMPYMPPSHQAPVTPEFRDSRPRHSIGEQRHSHRPTPSRLGRWHHTSKMNSLLEPGVLSHRS